ncbi:MAG: DUF308 domain-containing protein [Bacteroidota bacterium]|nr:DUF308 domain-containing protein [Bacteroidota bacterium]
MLKDRFTNWWMPAIIGIIAIILGITILGNPDITLLFIIKYLGLSLGITGIIVVASNYSKRDSNNGTFWIWEGILNIIIGIFIFIFPKFFVSVFTAIIGIGIIIVGLLFLFYYFSTKKHLANKWIYLISSILFTILGIIVLFNPFEAAQTISIIIGLVLIAIGGLTLFISYGIKSVDKSIDEEL